MSNEYDFEVIGGDITGSEKIIISVCAIGITQNRKRIITTVLYLNPTIVEQFSVIYI